MAYQYECFQCEARSPEPHSWRSDAEAERDAHRDAAHGGLAPAAGDAIRRANAGERGEGCLSSGSFWILLFLLALVLANCWGR
ncbi:hypothetical protein [Streptomyces sp. NPDC004008]